MTTETLIKAIDAYNEAEEALQICPPDKQEMFEKLAEKQHEKLCEVMQEVDA